MGSFANWQIFLSVVALFDQPFELALSHEPGATLSRTVTGL